MEEGFIIDDIDCKKLTPKAAEYRIRINRFAHSKDATLQLIKLNNAKIIKTR